MDIFNGDIKIPDGENLWQKYIDENKDMRTEFSLDFSGWHIPTAQEDLVFDFMFFDAELKN